MRKIITNAIIVTLNKNNALRGCIGYAEPVRPQNHHHVDVQGRVQVHIPTN